MVCVLGCPHYRLQTQDGKDGSDPACLIFQAKLGQICLPTIGYYIKSQFMNTL